MENQKNTSNRFKIVLGIGLAIGIAFGVYRYREAQAHIRTDDAQVERFLSPIIPKVSGYLTQVSVSDNQLVHAGDTLFCIDPTDYQIKVTEAQANVASAAQALAAARKDVGQAEANVQSVKSSGQSVAQTVEGAQARLWRAANDAKRFDVLYQKRHATKQQWEQAQAAQTEAESQLKSIQAQVQAAAQQTKVAQARSQVLRQQIKVAEANYQRALSQLKAAQTNLSYTVVKAPADGQVSRVSLQPGQWVQPGQTLLQWVNTREVWIMANFKETQLEKMKEGQKVSLVADAYPDVVWEGTVQSMAPATGAKFSLLPPDNATGNFVKIVQRLPVKIALLPQQKQPLSLLRAGMNVEVDVHCAD